MVGAAWDDVHAACPCAGGFELARAVEVADAVFVGHVVALVPVADARRRRIGSIATMEVMAAWKGADGGRTTLFSAVPEGCGVALVSDATYLVFGRGGSEAGRELETAACDGTRRIGLALEEVRGLGPPVRGELPAELAHEPLPCGAAAPRPPLREARELAAALGLGQPRDARVDIVVCGADERLHRFEVRVTAGADEGGASITTAVFREVPLEDGPPGLPP